MGKIGKGVKEDDVWDLPFPDCRDHLSRNLSPGGNLVEINHYPCYN